MSTERVTSATSATSSTLRAAVLPTPVGPLAVVVDEGGTVVVSGFSALEDTLGRLGPEWAGVEVDRDADLGEVARAVADYTAGDVGALDRVAVRQPGGELLQRMWSELRGVEAGSSVSYSELAARTDHPTAVRVAGNACARNLVAPFVPCHRVLKADGTVGSYYYGPDVKRALLVHEGWTGAATAQLALGD
jgi:methylated-DNA-[protein]-cysteine S-methyltransferase